MTTTNTDIRQHLKNRIAELENKRKALEEKKVKILSSLADNARQLDALKTVYESEAGRFGEISAPLFKQGEESYRFAGMKVGEALRIIRDEQPQITREEATKILQEGGFDFKGKRPISAVHFAFVAQDRERKRKENGYYVKQTG